MPLELQVVVADITTLKLNAIVNAANSTLLGGGGRGEVEMLALCYALSLMLAIDNNVETIAFPAISTGAYGFPPGAAARITVRAVREFATILHKTPPQIMFCCFSEASAALHDAALTSL